MTHFDFDKPVGRRGSCSVKHDGLLKAYGRDDLLPLWVADMDFETPAPVRDAIRRQLDGGVLGYTFPSESAVASVTEWIAARHGWSVRPEWLTFIPGIVKGIGLAVTTLTRPGDRIVIQPPVYHPFRLVPEANGRTVVENPLVEEGESYRMDLGDLERRFAEGARMLILSNPHNPAGIVWDAATLRRVAELADRYGVTVVSDEIHCDMALSGFRHVPYASVCASAARRSITFAAPSKTFNMAGVVSSYAVVPDEELRARFYGALEASELNAPTMFAPTATEAAFRLCDPWRRAMLEYVERNVGFVRDFCARRLPGIRAWRPQASFLVWLDCRGLGLPHEELIDLFVNRARLALNDGAMFGRGGEGFMRLNVGTRRAVLEEAMERLAAALGR